MAFTFDASPSSSTATATSVSFSHVIDAHINKVLFLVGGAADGSGTINSGTYNGQASTELVSQGVAASECTIRCILKADLPAPGSYTVVVGADEVMTVLHGGAFAVGRLKQTTTPEDTGTDSIGIGTSSSITLTNVSTSLAIMVMHRYETSGDVPPDPTPGDDATGNELIESYGTFGSNESSMHACYAEAENAVLSWSWGGTPAIDNGGACAVAMEVEDPLAFNNPLRGPLG